MTIFQNRTELVVFLAAVILAAAAIIIGSPQ